MACLAPRASREHGGKGRGRRTEAEWRWLLGDAVPCGRVGLIARTPTVPLAAREWTFLTV